MSITMKTLIFFLLVGFHVAAIAESECVVLLHGWAQVTNSMGRLDSTLSRAGYNVVNVKYASRRYEIEILAKDAIGRGVSECRSVSTGTIHFVTHSLGGILLRVYLEHEELEDLGRVVMLGPPNQGSELVESLLHVPGFKTIGGPASVELGTSDDNILSNLSPVDFDLGIIAGTTSINPLGFLFMPGPNDSIVSVENTKVEGMKAHLVLPVTHQLMMRNNEVIDHAVHYLKTGTFIP